MLYTSKEFTYKGKEIVIFATELSGNQISVECFYKSDLEHAKGNSSKVSFSEAIFKPNKVSYLSSVDLKNTIIYYYNHLKEYEVK